jgi:Abortive infection C-terminus
MANTSNGEKRKLEKYLQMGGGYVLDFSNRTFQEFVFDSVGLNIDDEAVGGFGSKAVRLRNFWARQPDHIVGKLLKDFIEYRDESSTLPNVSLLKEACRQIAERLLHSAPIHDAEVISVLSQQEEFKRLATGVLDSINKNDPQSGLDRLHTFTMAFARSLCEKHGIRVEPDKPLHSVFGEYVKKLKASNVIETQMTERILKSSIAVLDAFNDVRNNRSLAHHNDVLNRNESLLILNHVVSVIRFLWALEDSNLFCKQIFTPEEEDLFRELDL